MKATVLIILGIFVAQLAMGQKAPIVSKTEFSEKALQQPLFGLDGQQKSAGEILRANKGKTVLLYIWATWCPDCIKGFPELHALQKANPDVHTVFFSLDRQEQPWKDGIKKFHLEGEHYWFKTDWKNDFTNDIELNWIPRYLIIGPDGHIAKYYSIKADDPVLQEAIDTSR
ncbi:TlpA family protein disulfide reductase [Parapedobacter indicus]|uniref:Thioredoxin-like n=1 Tax=Parapedobacter indicus TaxID=1477437 RepID=A0A1I3EVF4_9SPHI|nr:thioredoxin-like domain-containing protein [Parapedobacter indicus]PPL03429.1 thioredoxin-like protein [Parapedobacter indicus]SFI02918.1 Thioredoxin-like [Parapedobacter indicus]